MKSVILLCLLSSVAHASGKAWRHQVGRFAAFDSPAEMTKDTKRLGIDSVMDTYESRDISLTFDSEMQSVPVPLQANIDNAVAWWTRQRTKSWKIDSYVENPDGSTVASVSCNNDAKDKQGRAYYLYLGFAVENHSFAIHVRFRRLDSLDDIERILKSIRLSSREKAETPNQKMQSSASRRTVPLSMTKTRPFQMSLSLISRSSSCSR